jgi:hypothetical protein
VEVIPPVGAVGLAGLLAFVILYLLNANRADRKEHRIERQEWDARFKAQQEQHAADVRDLRERVAKLETELRDETLRADRAETKLDALTGGKMT